MSKNPKGVNDMKVQCSSKTYKPTLVDSGALLPYEWQGSYFIGKEEIAAVTKVLKTRSPFRFYGHTDEEPYSDRLEKAYCEKLGRKHALAVNSGTAALTIALRAMDIGPGDEVLVQSYMWISCPMAVVLVGAIPRLVDVDDTWCIDSSDLERKIGPRTKCVIMVDMSGAPGDLECMEAICKKHNIYMLEDFSQANGAKFKGKYVGSFGNMAISSHQYNKNLSSGEGGIIVCDDDKLYDRAVAAHDLGYPRKGGRLAVNDPDTQMWGQGSRSSELTAALTFTQFSKLDSIVACMHHAKYRIRKGLEEIKGLKLRRIIDQDGDSSSFLLMRWPNEEIRDKVVKETRNAGIVTGPKGLNNITMPEWHQHIYYQIPSLVKKKGLNSAGRPWTDPLNEFAKDYSYDKGTCPFADDLVACGSLLSIPPALTDEVCDRVVEEFQKVAKKYI